MSDWSPFQRKRVQKRLTNIHQNQLPGTPGNGLDPTGKGQAKGLRGALPVLEVACCNESEEGMAPCTPGRTGMQHDHVVIIRLEPGQVEAGEESTRRRMGGGVAYSKAVK